MKRIGVFLGYAPEQSIRAEGLGRLLAFFIKGASEQGRYEITIGCPHWYRKELKDLLDDHEIDVEKIRILSTDGDPYILRLHRWVLKRQLRVQPLKRLGLKGKLRRFGQAFGQNLINVGMSSSISEAFPHFAKASIRGSILLVAALMALPVLLLLALVMITPSRIRKPFSRGRQVARSLVAGTLRASWMYGLFEELRRRELGRLVHKINAQSKIEGWLVPTLFWPECVGIKARKVVVAPDVVFFDFPTHYADTSSRRIIQNASTIVEHADHIITYSEYVKRVHLVEGLGVGERKISVVRHGAVSMEDYLTLGGKRLSPDLRREVALDIVSRFQGFGSRDRLITRLDFENDKILFYSSQVRHHKNIMMLIKSVEEINRRSGSRSIVRLLLTANLVHRPDILNYIHTNKLENIVFWCPNVPSKVLAAFGNLATLAVTPTLFEGGFPFTFCEAYSVGTPSIMSDIPVVREVLDQMSGELRNAMLFDPYDIDDLSEKILWGISNRDALLELQKELYDFYPSWSAVASKYLQIVDGTLEGLEN